MKLQEIANRIKDHLKRFEADKSINATKDGRDIPPFYNAWATSAGSYVRIVYVSFQGVTNLRKADAERYLQWLDAGNIGKHYKALSFNTLVAAATTESKEPK
jgi:hypothetical protein